MRKTVRLIKRLFRQSGKDSFSARKMFSITNYGREEVTNEQLFQEWIRYIKSEIHYRSNDRKISCFIDLPKDKEIFLEKIINYLKDRGFEIEILNLKNKYLYITWDNVVLD
jgi:hypothetical protein